MSTLTAEQRARIERNRLAALQRRAKYRLNLQKQRQTQIDSELSSYSTFNRNPSQQAIRPNNNRKRKRCYHEMQHSSNNNNNNSFSSQNIINTNNIKHISSPQKKRRKLQNDNNMNKINTIKHNHTQNIQHKSNKNNPFNHSDSKKQSKSNNNNVISNYFHPKPSKQHNYKNPAIKKDKKHKNKNNTKNTKKSFKTKKYTKQKHFNPKSKATRKYNNNYNKNKVWIPISRQVLFNRLSHSKFRSKFKLGPKEVTFVNNKYNDLERHAFDFVTKRLSAAYPINDGKQTPMRGHPVFIAQHATATCCRSCLSKWHYIQTEKPLTNEQIIYMVQVILHWIKLKCPRNRNNYYSYN